MTSKRPNGEHSRSNELPKRARSEQPKTTTMTYGVWNNKGGVGKTTLTFHLATQYARTHPWERVLVVDMCPQANVSSALLGLAGDEDTKKLDSLRNQKVEEELRDGQNCSDSEDDVPVASYFKSISGYLTMRVQNKQKDHRPEKYIINVSKYNGKVPSNLYLMPGDHTLELSIKRVDEMRNRTPNMDRPWKDGTEFIKHMIKQYGRGLRRKNIDNLTVFIDTNPAFSTYTELAIAASDRLITPVNADDFSRAAVNSMLASVYGFKFDPRYEDESFKEIRKSVFAYRAEKEGMRLPKLHLVINNRVTTYKTRTTKTFQSMGDMVVDALYEGFKKDRSIFSTRAQQPFLKATSRRVFKDTESAMKGQFEEDYFMDLKDFHKTAVQSIHTGTPLASFHKTKVEIGDTKDVVDKKSVEACLKMVNEIVQKL